MSKSTWTVARGSECACTYIHAGACMHAFTHTCGGDRSRPPRRPMAFHPRAEGGSP